MEDFDVILGMNWISRYRACMDYFQKVVTFQSEDGVENNFQGERITEPLNFVSCIKAQKMIKKGCMAWLATMKVKDTKEVKVDEVPMVREYLDVFPRNLLGLPPDREIEFVIDLVLGT